MIENHLPFFMNGQGVLRLPLNEAEVRSRAQTCMEQGAQARGAAAIIHLVTAEDLFRRIQDGNSAARARALLVRTRFTVSCEGLLKTLSETFEDHLEMAALPFPKNREDPLTAVEGPKEVIRSFQLALDEAELLSPEEKRDHRLNRLLQSAHQFVQRAESHRWDHLTQWPSAALTLHPAVSQEGHAGLKLFEAWLHLKRRMFPEVVDLLGQALKVLRHDQDHGDPAHWEIIGRLHYFSGFSLIIPADATMKELHDATLRFRDSMTAFEKAGKGAEWSRHLLASTYDRLAKDHTEGNAALKFHYECQAFQTRAHLQPALPRARVVSRPGKNRRTWWSRFRKD